MMRRGLGWGLVALACACPGSPESLPPPTILSVEPDALPVNTRGALTVTFDARYPVAVDYGAKTVDARRVSGSVWVDGREAEPSRFDPEGIAIVSVPRGLGVGEHPVLLRLDDGREAMAPKPLVLYPPGQGKADPDDAGVLVARDAGPVEEDAGSDAGDGGARDAGPGPDDPIREGDITGFSFDAIEGTRTSRQGFAITVRAEGPRAMHFDGSVELTASRGTVSPPKIGPCDDGVCTATIVMDAPAGNVRLFALDAFGATGESNTFRLEPSK
ncbi:MULTISPECIES: hypothetical protein [Corallococcus]|uniref:hypothetical protein n=1 Tax=Corallococcus TaxID=83461 RepID=UPI00117CAE19|nr:MULTISPECIES: hypothetical protein [Corallococcus]NBD11237.1 hypothetical protein [Corallococcus silvisoli]TSC26576.1 hypothetical protein FOF48_21045 [Corallococcus sp. Z5C101001]